MWNKLKHEWKTAAWGLASLAMEIQMYVDPTILDPILSEEQKPLVHIAIPVGFFLLRQWTGQKEDLDV